MSPMRSRRIIDRKFEAERAWLVKSSYRYKEYISPSDISSSEQDHGTLIYQGYIEILNGNVGVLEVPKREQIRDQIRVNLTVYLYSTGRTNMEGLINGIGGLKFRNLPFSTLPEAEDQAREWGEKVYLKKRLIDCLNSYLNNS